MHLLLLLHFSLAPLPPAALLAVAHGPPTLASSGRLLAPLVEQRVAGDVQVLKRHLVIVHTHGGQSTGHLLLQ